MRLPDIHPFREQSSSKTCECNIDICDATQFVSDANADTVAMAVRFHSSRVRCLDRRIPETNNTTASAMANASIAIVKNHLDFILVSTGSHSVLPFWSLIVMPPDQNARDDTPHKTNADQNYTKYQQWRKHHSGPNDHHNSGQTPLRLKRF
jgi:hypothetical protein